MIYLDNIIFSLQQSGGISVVWYELIKKMLKTKKKFINIEYEKANNNIFRKMIKPTDISIDYRKSNPNIIRYFSPKINENEPFIFHSSYYRICNNKNAINITTVHDFTYEYFVHGIRKWLHCWQKQRAIRKSDYIVCITQNTKKDLLKFMPYIDENKIRIIYNGVSEDYFVMNNSNKLDLSNYILFVGSRSLYKNFKFVVDAIINTEYKIAICGKALNRNEEIYLNKTIGQNRYLLFENISNQKLNQLYNSVFCLAYPSSYEGFGIPVIEAQRAGCPVIALNASSIPEIIGNTPLLINELSTSEFLLKLDILKNNNVRNKIIADGIDNSKKYSWDKMGNEYINLYKNVLNSHENIFNNCIIQQRSND